ncbi:MAG: VanZ family protein [Clostridia bacterium]|nr:VanZ family protein [Clostridia bacterium]
MKKLRAWALCFIWMAVIFAMSTMPGDVSGEQSGTVVEILSQALEQLGISYPETSPLSLELLIRKGAHMAEYAVLFWLYRRALRLSGARCPGRMALLLCALYASSDEFHQVFTEGRGPSPVDVAIDTADAALMGGLCALCERIAGRRRAS